MNTRITPTTDTRMNETDFMKLFTEELSYQDPLKPIDNREFMAQMAQFSLLQEARGQNELLMAIAAQNQRTHSLTLLGKTVQLNNDTEKSGLIRGVTFIENQMPQLSVQFGTGLPITVALDSVTRVAP